jgi:hypothetical protein
LHHQGVSTPFAVAFFLSIKSVSSEFHMFSFLIPKLTNFELFCQGVIANLKDKFRKILIQRLLTKIDVNKNATWQRNIVDACHMLANFWNAAKNKTIVNIVQDCLGISSADY